MKSIKTLFAVALLALCGVAVAQSNILGTLLTSAARTETTASADITNTSTRGAHIVVNVTAYTSGQWTPIVQGKDPVSLNYYTICTGSVISGTGAFVLRVYPAFTAGANSCNDFLPRTWRLQMVGGSTPVSTFSVGYLADY